MKKRILIIDQDQKIVELLEDALESSGYNTVGINSSMLAYKILKNDHIDLIIMEKALADIEGSCFVEMLRAKNIYIPVICLTSQTSIQDLNECLLKGADDYITKPFDIGELQLRITVILRRQAYTLDLTNSFEQLCYEDLSLNVKLQEVSRSGNESSLSKLETALLKLLIENKGRVLDRDFFLKNIWNSSKSMRKKNVDLAINRLKAKIDPAGEKNYIKTIRGIGYMLASFYGFFLTSKFSNKFSCYSEEVFLYI